MDDADWREDFKREHGLPDILGGVLSDHDKESERQTRELIEFADRIQRMSKEDQDRLANTHGSVGISQERPNYGLLLLIGLVLVVVFVLLARFGG